MIGAAERDAWLRHMLGSLEAVTAARRTPAETVARIRAYLVDVAAFPRQRLSGTCSRPLAPRRRSWARRAQFH